MTHSQSLSNLQGLWVEVSRGRTLAGAVPHFPLPSFASLPLILLLFHILVTLIRFEL